MLKTRVIATLLIRDGVVVQSVGFKQFLPIGRPSVCIEFLSRWGVDEIVVLDIGATPQGRAVGTEFIDEVSRECFVPISTGGGFREIAEIEAAVLAGSEKVVINSAALEEASIIDRSAALFGTQCVVASIDAKKTVGWESGEASWRVYSHCGRTETQRHPAEWAKELVDRGAGEILINSIDRDGSGDGYDLALIEQVVRAVDVPVIALGGVGRAQDFVDGILIGGATAVAAGNIFHHTEHAVVLAKETLSRAGINLRRAADAEYGETALDWVGRVTLASHDSEQAERATGPGI